MRVVLGFCAFVSIFGARPAWAAFEVAYLDGTAEFKATLGDAWRKLDIGDEVAEGGIVRTAAASAVELVKKGVARVVIAPNTLVLLSFDSETSANRLVIHTGQILASLLQTGASLQVRTHSVVAGVRGTQFVVLAEARGGTQVAVKEGKVYVLARDTGKRKAQGELLPAGTMETIGADLIAKVRSIEGGDAAYFDFGVFDKRARDEGIRLFDHYARQQDSFFKEFQRNDLDDLQLFKLKELDDMWTYYLESNLGYLEALQNQPLKGK